MCNRPTSGRQPAACIWADGPGGAHVPRLAPLLGRAHVHGQAGWLSRPSGHVVTLLKASGVKPHAQHLPRSPATRLNSELGPSGRAGHGPGPDSMHTASSAARTSMIQHDVRTEAGGEGSSSAGMKEQTINNPSGSLHKLLVCFTLRQPETRPEFLNIHDCSHVEVIATSFSTRRVVCAHSSSPSRVLLPPPSPRPAGSDTPPPAQARAVPHSASAGESRSVLTQFPRSPLATRESGNQDLFQLLRTRRKPPRSGTRCWVRNRPLLLPSPRLSRA